MKKTTTAIIGYGRIGRMHAENLRSLPDVSLVAVCDKQTEDDATDVPFVTDSAEIFADDSVETVIIAASSDAHVSLICDAARAGKHVFCENPVSFEPSLVAEAGRACREAGVKLQVGFNRRFDPDFSHLREQVGRLGRIHTISIVNRDPRRPALGYVPRSGGLFMDFSVHDFDMCRFLSRSEVTEVCATGAVLIDRAIADLGDVDTALTVLKLESGVLCTVDNSREAHYGYDQRIEVFGENGSLRAENHLEGATHFYMADAVHSRKPKWSFAERYRESFSLELRAFFDSVRRDTPPLVGADDTMRAVAVARAADESLHSGAPVEMTYD